MATRRQPTSTALAAACAALIVAQHVAARALRDGLFLSTFGAGELPKVMLAAAAVGLAAVIGSARVMARFGPRRALPGLLVLSGLLYAAEWKLLAYQHDLAVVLIYLHASIAGGISVSGFWSIANERFDPFVLRRIAGFLAAGSAMGGLVGGVTARLFVGRFELSLLLLVIAASALVAAVGLGFLAQKRVDRDPGAAEMAGMRSVTSDGYLRTIATLVTLTGLSSAVVDFAFKATVTAKLPTGEALVGFFALFYTATSVVSVLLQLSLARWLPAHAGLGTALSVMPVVVVALSLLGLALPQPWVVVVLRASGVSLETSLFRAAYEPLYAPLPLSQKRATKTIIDVAADRIGEALGSGWVLVAASIVPALASKAGLVAAALASSLAVFLSMRLERGYVTELAASLRTGKVRLDSDDVSDATTRLTLSQTALELDREALIRQIEELRRKSTAPAAAAASPEASVARAAADDDSLFPATASAGTLLPSTSSSTSLLPSTPSSTSLLPSMPSITSLLPSSRSSATPIPSLGTGSSPNAGAAARPVDRQRLLARIHELESGDPLRVKDALGGEPLELELVSLVIPLLGSDDNAEAAVTALRVIAPKIPGQLVDALLDRDRPLRLRRRVPRVLRYCPDRRAVRGLAEALQDPEREIRRRAALALRELSRKDAALKPPRRVVVEAASHEIEKGGTHALDQVFTLLGLVLDSEALDLARRAIASADEKLKGTALEYLEHVLPDTIRAGIWPHLQAGRLPRQAPVRNATDIAAELKRSMG
jgi:ATP:ADP antiporter, AAA family